MDYTRDQLVKLCNTAERLADMALAEWGRCNEYYIQTSKVEYYRSRLYAMDQR